MKNDKKIEKQMFDIFQKLFQANSEIKDIGFWVNQYGVDTDDIAINHNSLDFYFNSLYDNKLEKARALLKEITSDKDDISESLIIPLQRIIKEYDERITDNPIVKAVWDFNFESYSKKMEKLISNYLGNKYPFYQLNNGVYFTIYSDGRVTYDED